MDGIIVIINSFIKNFWVVIPVFWPFCSDWLAKEDKILQCFYKHITGPNKQHCLLSSISLLKLLYEKYPKKIEVDDVKKAVEYLLK